MGYQVLRGLLRRVKTRFSLEQWKRWKCDMFFPIRNFLLCGKPISVKVSGISFLLAPKGSTAAGIWSGLYFQRKELEFILETLEAGMTFLDIGANSGLFTIPAAKKIGHGKIYAFEPYTWTFQVLQENIRLNDLNLSNVTLVRTALGDYIGEAVLQVNAPGKDGLNTLGKPTHPDCQVIGEETVPITTLDAFIETEGISKVDVMKVGVEGAELLVFRGCRKLLQGKEAPLILYESRTFNTAGFGYHPVEITWLLQEYGYYLFVLDEETGHVAPFKPDRGYDIEVVAVKPEHPCFGKMQGEV